MQRPNVRELDHVSCKIATSFIVLMFDILSTLHDFSDCSNSLCIYSGNTEKKISLLCLYHSLVFIDYYMLGFAFFLMKKFG